MKKLLLMGMFAILGFVACKKDDDSNNPISLPSHPRGQYRLEKIEFRNSNHQLIETIKESTDSTQYFYYENSGQFKKVVRMQPSECFESWAAFMGDFVGSTTYDSTQYLPPVDGIILHFYLGWQGVDDREYLYYFLTKTDKIEVDTVSCN